MVDIGILQSLSADELRGRIIEGRAEKASLNALLDDRRQHTRNAQTILVALDRLAQEIETLSQELRRRDQQQWRQGMYGASRS